MSRFFVENDCTSGLAVINATNNDEATSNTNDTTLNSMGKFL